jgi:serine/threonine-protein kinase
MPDRIGRYEVVGRIAVGDRKELMLGREASGRPVAIKRIPRGIGRGGAARHPNLVETIELVQIGDDYYLVMEYLEGENLAGLIRRLIKRRERISYALAAHIIAEVCDGLHAAHMAGELHRAISPEHIFITYGGDVKLLDLGIAPIDPESPYRSPEQTGGRPLGRQSDVYSLGLVLYELTTLRRLFESAADERPVPRPSTQVNDYPAELEPICLHAIEPDAAERFRSAIEMRDALLGVTRALGIDDDPSQSLASKLMRLFGDRVAMKRDLLDRLRVGMPLGDLVPTDVDEEVEVPLVERPPESDTTEKSPAVPMPEDGDDDKTGLARAAPPRTPITRPRGSPDPKPRTSRPSAAPPPAVAEVGRGGGVRWGVALLFVLAIGIGGAAGGWLRLRESSGAAPAPAPIDARLDAPVPDAAPKPPAMVTITIETEPVGAKVIVDGEARGMTPVDLRIDGALKPLAIELRRDGFTTKKLDVIPDRDQTLHEKLAR